MPIYTYKCKDCGAIFDFLIIKKSEQPKCQKCGGKRLEKQLTAPVVRMGSPQTIGKTCCGQNSPCDVPPCSDTGTCTR